ncbi:acyltransferase family protein [Montanilutibacter psychrotolerans]|uniref:Acyltransferase n=1 Tax=Montanilutibacter psychrotolerans TaxID=1327343 RepID=A0A3M8T0M6_9GAMM|nr:acyltransferase family protein [Lysobacter psychrotolerans]RNF84252.1 acyltransferase [Lysobacter psychrotolerans]
MSELKYRPEIDGLRAIAVLAVVVYHASAAWLPGGFVGVDVFFVISGYLITSLLLREWKRHGRIDLMAFYARRARRLLPAVWVVIATSVAAGSVLFAPGRALDGVADSAIASLLFVANLHFVRITGGYFDGPSGEMPLLHLWSLSVEEQFYLVLPLLLIAVLRWRGPRAVPGTLVLASLASLLLAENWLQIRASIAFYQMPARFWELAAGGLVATLGVRGLKAWAPPTLLATGLLLVLLAVAWGPGEHFPGVGALPAVAGTWLVLWAIHDEGALGLPGVVLRSRVMVFFGLISYSLYLWHWPLLAFERMLTIGPANPWVRLGLCALAVVLAWLSYRFVETPFRRSMPTLPKPRVVAMGAAGSLALLASVLALGKLMIGPPPDALVSAAENDRPANMRRCHYGLDDSIAGLKPASCRSLPAREPALVIWGDSHALAWQPFGWEVASAANQSAIGFTLDSCAPISNFATRRPDFPGHREKCQRHNALVRDYLRQHRVDTLVIAAHWLAYFQDRPTHAGEVFQSPASIATGLEQAVAEVAPRVRRVILIEPSPALLERAPKCIAAGLLDRCAMPRDMFDHQAAPARRVLANIAARHDNVEVLDPRDFFCNEVECPVLKDGYALFWDDNHVSSTAARAFARAYLREPARWSLSGGGTPGANARTLPVQ